MEHSMGHSMAVHDEKESGDAPDEGVVAVVAHPCAGDARHLLRNTIPTAMPTAIATMMAIRIAMTIARACCYDGDDDRF